MNSRHLIAACAALVGTPLAAQSGPPWSDMDYGPFLSAAIGVAEGNIANKGIAVRLDAPDEKGGVARGTRFAVFDTDTLRFAAAWSGELIDWRSVVYDGSHGTNPSIAGHPIFVTPDAPGWARPGTEDFTDSRVRGHDDRAYGPLPKEWGRWIGLHRHGGRVAFRYEIGGASVLESPGLAHGDIFMRAIELGPRTEPLVLALATPGGRELRIERDGDDLSIAHLTHPAPASASGEAADALSLRGDRYLVVDGSEAFDMTEHDFTIVARVRSKNGGTIFARAPASGPWAPHGKTFFIRDGRLGYDTGWVGVVTSKTAVADGEWHDVAVSFDAATHRVSLFVDGEPDAEKVLDPGERQLSHEIRIGFTSPNFPSPSALDGDIARLEFWNRRLDAAELKDPERGSDGLLAAWASGPSRDGAIDSEVSKLHAARSAPLSASADRRERNLAIGVTGGPEGLAFSSDEDVVCLRIPAGDSTRIGIAYLEPESTESARVRLRSVPAPGPLDGLTKGGPSLWSETIETRVRPFGESGGPFEVDEITAPLENPWNSWMRIGGFDFFPGGERAAVATWMGDVWIVSGIGGDPGPLRWRRIATGLYQPLGVKIREGEVFVLGRDQITRLHDLDGDAEADFYECFHHGAQATPHFHEFAMDLQTDAEGNFYYMKGGRHALDSVVPQHGTLIRVARDGSSSEILANGFRAPNGLCVNDDGTFISSDQEGHWTPSNRINWIRPNGFYGYMYSYHRGERPTSYDPPLCWLAKEFDRSPAEQLWVRSVAWGPLDGALLSLSYGTGEVALVLHEEVDGVRQGGVTRLPVPMFPTGTMRARFHPTDGHLYIAGLFGWAGNRTQAGGFYRVRRTLAPVDVPVALHATKDGVYVRFSDPLDARRATRTGSYQVTRWNYRWLERYGSDDWRVSDGEKGRDTVAVKSVRLSRDGCAVFLELDSSVVCMQQRIAFRLASAAGGRISSEIFHTVHALGDSARWLTEFD